MLVKREYKAASIKPYTVFWNIFEQIERSNYFLNAIVSTAQKGYSLNSRTVMCLLKVSVRENYYYCENENRSYPI